MEDRDGCDDGYDVGMLDADGFHDGWDDNEGAEEVLGLLGGSNDGFFEGIDETVGFVEGLDDIVGFIEGPDDIVGFVEGFMEGFIEGFIEGNDDTVGFTEGIDEGTDDTVGFVDGCDDGNDDGILDADGFHDGWDDNEGEVEVLATSRHNGGKTIMVEKYNCQMKQVRAKYISTVIYDFMKNQSYHTRLVLKVRRIN